MRFKLSLLAMVTILGMGYGTTVAAQQQPAAQQQVGVQGADMRDDRDGGVDMGWLGLAGLIGLVGLKRSQDRTRLDHSASHASR